MNNTQRTLDLSPRSVLRLSEVERLIRKHRILVPAPCRRTLIAWCEEGTFLTAPRTNPRGPHLVYEDSFLEWVERLKVEGEN
jgi:hypothetical protein